MRIALAIATLLVASSLGACKFEAGITTNNNLTIDGKSVSATRSQIVDGIGEFECIKSPSGRCHYVLFTETCARAQEREGVVAGEQACNARVVESFTLDAGTSRQLVHLPKHLRECVGHDAVPVAPGCLRPAG